jgi:cell wall-associated NlpC family hydrolase
MSAWWQEYVGLPFRFDGRDRSGIDCWGLVRLVFAERAGIDLPSYGEIRASDLARVAEIMTAARHLPPWQMEVPVPKARALDVVLMLGRRRGQAAERMHVGVMVDAARVLHVEAETAAVVVPLDHPQLRRRVCGVFRHEDLA